MMGMKDTIITFALLGLFIFAFLAFIYQTSQDNGSTSILNDPALNKTFNSINTSINNFSDTATTQMSASNNETISGGAFGLISYAIIGSVRTFTSVITGTYNTIVILAVNTLHVPAIVLNIILAILLVSLIFMGWRIYRQGQ